MREIKFKAWDKRSKRWWYNVQNAYDLQNNHQTPDPSIHDDYSSELLLCCSFGEVLSRKDEFEVVQFTGLHDKNGVEIYEGDIISYYNRYSDKTYVHFVAYDELWASFGLYEKDNKWCKESDWQKIQEVEVLGNIYEHPHLIK